MKKKIRISEKDLRKVLKKIISEQYDTESPANDIVAKLGEVGIPEQYLDAAKLDIIEIEGTKNFKEKKLLIQDFKNEINRVLAKFRLAVPKNPEEKERLTKLFTALDIMIDNLSYKADIKNISLN